MDSPTNQLAGETSPYLLQHARNPVRWYPWADEALEKARREDKPILLSVGYSACHWCHVMAHESFEDPQTAEVMNALFVNIKVDREERPDLDKIYQTAHYFLTQRSGGWPLTMFLTPDQVPFFGGTYFPKEPRHGLPAFTDLLRRVERFYRDHREDVEKQNRSVVEVLDRVIPRGKPDEAVLNASPLDQARHELEQAFDPQHGGFGPAPKFPHPTQLERLLRHYAATANSARPDDGGLDMVRHSLTRMARGGVYDQLGGGFCRYSVDERWMIPHFEKMLYDNGLLLSLYAQAWAVTADPMFKRVAEQTAGWVMREMQSPEGGYYSSLDADSEGEEGKYYVWTPEEIRSLLSEQQYRLLEQRFGLDRAANFEGKWHLYVARTSAQVAQAAGIPEPEVEQALEDATAKLLRVREARVAPGRDDKVLTSWNALMVKGMSVAAQHLGRVDLLDSAQLALDFVRRELWQGQRLLATYKDGRAHLSAYLDDYAFLIDAILTFAQSRVRPDDLAFASLLADVLVERFEDRAHGGFFFTGEDHERLIMRPKTLADDATPSGNGVAAFALGRLGHLLGETRYLDAAERALKGGRDAVLQAPSAHCTMLLALEEYLFPTQTVVIRGEQEALARWQQRATAPYAPRRLTVAIPGQAQSLPALLTERRALGTTTAYVCSGHSCDAPVTDFGELNRVLAKSEVRREA